MATHDPRSLAALGMTPDLGMTTPSNDPANFKIRTLAREIPREVRPFVRQRARAAQQARSDPERQVCHRVGGIRRIEGRLPGGVRALHAKAVRVEPGIPA